MVNRALKILILEDNDDLREGWMSFFQARGHYVRGLALADELHVNVGVVVTTARTQIGDKVLGYESGADIYFTKPVDPNELMAGIAALAKRRYEAAGSHGALRLMASRHKVCGPQATIELTPGESSVLASLVKAAGQPLARWQLAELLGAGESLPSDAMLEMRVARLRKKLHAAGADLPAIRAMRKHGYVLSCEVVLV